MPLLTAFWEIAEREYQSFSFDTQTRTTVRNIILAFCVGIILAAAYMFYQKRGKRSTHGCVEYYSRHNKKG